MSFQNTLWLDRKYINLVSYRFEGFVWKSGNLANCRCLFCGDSKDHKNKKRGYFIQRTSGYYYFCHNCGTSISIKTLLKRLDHRLYREYALETFQETYGADEFSSSVSDSRNSGSGDALQHLEQLKTIAQLPKGHPAKEYVIQRKIPTRFQEELRWAPAFKRWTNGIVPEKFKSFTVDEERIIIPFFDDHSRFFAYSGRAIADVKNGVRYLTIVFGDAVPLLYGLDRVDVRKRIVVVEGPIDSMFLFNSIGLAGSHISTLTYLDASDIVVAYDNEPRKKETISKIASAIGLGLQVCIWPRWFEWKDINGAIQSGQSSAYIQSVIDCSTYSGLKAKIKLAEWQAL